jgi:RHH-type proline utilization regulon transcriptional repressor/proline dehydrogenase/delta 1-pyrroline-5-carboxylate dehydrogenase
LKRKYAFSISDILFGSGGAIVTDLNSIRSNIRSLHRENQANVLAKLIESYGLAPDARVRISDRAAVLITDIREASRPGLMEVFLAEYGLSTDEGVALMCLAEALLRVPDAPTMDDLIEDKIAPSAWGEHLGKSSSPLVNASTWALMLSGKVLKDSENRGLADTLHGAIKRLGEPVIRTAVKRAMKEMGHQFVLGETIQDAVKRGKAMEAKGYTYSYDMLGEAALTAHDAAEFYASYENAIKKLSVHATHGDPRENPGISIKLSALHPRYELGQQARVMEELVPRVRELALLAKNANMGLNIDAEEADRLDLSLDVIEAAIRDTQFSGWDGFGVVVQAYGKRASEVIGWLDALARELDRKFMVRLVKGAYWDTEIKLAQVDGVPDFPVFTHKSATDVSYICCARKLLECGDRIYPQFATHNAHTVCAILEMAKDKTSFEFQRLHGMGEALHRLVLEQEKTRCRIYAPVGAHSDLLAYLVRRLLENGANSSFVNQITNDDVAPETIAADPFDLLQSSVGDENKSVILPQNLFLPERMNSRGWDLRNHEDLEQFEAARQPFQNHRWQAQPWLADMVAQGSPAKVYSLSKPDDCLGTVVLATEREVEHALDSARSWNDVSAGHRREVLWKVADLYEKNAGELFAALCREAGKTPVDAVAELREAVDFLRFYGAEGVKHEAEPCRGVVSCISPWNFPLAIFTGQIAAALAAGNGVLAKPADPTPIVASIAVGLMRQAGVPANAIQLLPGEGPLVGAAITSDRRVSGVCFTGSTGVSKIINRNVAKNLEPDSMFIAETGGINAMIVDSTALPEQAVTDIVDSAFRSAGQRCSALRILYLQRDIAEPFLEMLYGAMDELEVGEPWNMSCDVGPIITGNARRNISDHIAQARESGKLFKQLDVPATGHFVGPAVIEVSGIEALSKEVFGPVLHVALFEAHEIDSIVQSINQSGYGLTFGLHTRIDDRVEHITSQLHVGNLYVNRNQIGAVVGSQPFGGEGMSGTGPKAGGPQYLKRFKHQPLPSASVVAGEDASPEEVQRLLDEAGRQKEVVLSIQDMPGPTGESNRLMLLGRGTVLCLGPTQEHAKAQMKIAQSAGCKAVAVVPGLEGSGTVAGFLKRDELSRLEGIDAVALWSITEDLTAARTALAEREGSIVPLIVTDQMRDFCLHERHLCIDTTASGGNASLLAAQ